MALKLDLGDVVRMKKAHPCGGYQWQVTRLGADIGLVCQNCRHYVLMSRAHLERRVRAVLASKGLTDADSPTFC
jgi:hypothetical protein